VRACVRACGVSETRQDGLENAALYCKKPLSQDRLSSTTTHREHERKKSVRACVRSHLTLANDLDGGKQLAVEQGFVQLTRKRFCSCVRLGVKWIVSSV
jgi:hypothetical protein